MARSNDPLDAAGKWMRQHPGLGRALLIICVIVALPLVLLTMAPVLLEAVAPPLDTSQDLYAVNRPIAFTFIDAAGETVGHRGALVGERLTLDQMPDYVPAAFISMEDRRFYSHHGVDIRGLTRAIWENFRAHHVVAGGSTITQQTAKIVFTSSERTMSRKMAELVDAASLEKSLTKKQILELYLNRIYLGSGAYGVDGAAHVYFGKSARNLTLPEAAMLATLTTAPSVFSPRRDLESAQERAKRVLDAMVETGAITQEQADAAKANPATISDPAIVDSRNFFLDTAADEATKLASVNGQPPTGDLIVHTTLEPKLQDAARHALVRTLNAKGKKAHTSEGAIVMMKPDGAVSALVGGKDYDASAFNRATQARRQPGSSFKPFVYLAALENGISPWDVRTDGPIDINGWSPTNYGGRQYGTITLAEALAHSVNTITAALGQEVGISTVVEAAQRCGITSPLEQNPALALGTAVVTPIEMTTAYAVFANGGYKVYPYYVTEVDDHGGHTLYKRTPPAPQRVIASHVDKDLVEMLYGVVTGGTIPAGIWHDVMSYAEEDLPSKPLDKSTPQAPTNVTSLDETMGVDTESGGESDSGVTLNSGTSDEDQSSGASDQSGQSDNQPGFFDWLFGQRRQEEQQRRQQQQQQQQEQQREQYPPPPGYDQQQRPPTVIRPPAPAVPPDPNSDGNNDGN